MQTGKITALYVRFSFDDGIDTESGSIEHQKALLKNYKTYEDSDYSRTDICSDGLSADTGKFTDVLQSGHSLYQRI